MSVIQSNLAAPAYGYDFVIATTQDSINTTIKEYLSGASQTEVAICYVADANGNPTPVDYNTFVQNANGTDPFQIPNGVNPATDPRTQNLFEARFMVGFKAQIGLPPYDQPQNIPDVVVLGSDTASVTFNLLCSEFIVVQYSPAGGYSPAAWMNQSQQDNDAWLFSTKVDLRFSLTSDTAYSTLPPAVQQQIKNLGAAAFSVQQLLFDLDNAALESMPTISGVTPGTTLYTCLQNDFAGKYFATLQQNAQPVLGCAIVQPNPTSSTLTLSDLNLMVNPYVGTDGKPVPAPDSTQSDLTTLNYLCAVNGDSLPPATLFTWNWLDTSEGDGNFDGAIAIRSGLFINWLNQQFATVLSQICLQPVCKVDDTIKGIKFDLEYTVNSTPQPYTVLTGQSPDADGFTHVLTFSFSKSDKSNKTIGELESTCTVTSDVYLSAGEIKVVTTAIINIHISFLKGVSKGNFADYTATTILSLGVSDTGQIIATPQNNVQDNSDKIDTSWWAKVTSLGQIDDVINKYKTNTRQMLSDYLGNFNDALGNCLNSPQSWIFPGGNTFDFKDVGFSDTQDLVAHITYADPS